MEAAEAAEAARGARRQQRRCRPPAAVPLLRWWRRLRGRLAISSPPRLAERRDAPLGAPWPDRVPKPSSSSAAPHPPPSPPPMPPRHLPRPPKPPRRREGEEERIPAPRCRHRPTRRARRSLAFFLAFRGRARTCVASACATAATAAALAAAAAAAAAASSSRRSRVACCPRHRLQCSVPASEVAATRRTPRRCASRIGRCRGLQSTCLQRAAAPDVYVS